MPDGLVVVEYADLVADKDLTVELLRAWGEDGIGIIGIRGVPGWMETYPEAERFAHPLAHLPAESLQKLEHEASLYNAGWSHGKEKLGDKPDLAKGSFYFNPLSDKPGTDEDREKYPWAMPCNIWPDELPGMDTACKTLGQAMHECVGHLARLCDRAVAARLGSKSAMPSLGELVTSSEKCKGRLLYYYPPAPATGSEAAVPEDGWIGWHNDSGFFTALAPDIYVDDDTGAVIENPDPEAAGLWVVARSGGSMHVPLPRDCLCVQVGECTQVVTGGMLVATPHCVRACRPSTTSGRRVGRVSCPCFIDSHPSYPLKMPLGTEREAVLAKGVSDKVPPLGDRWEEDGQTFGDFLGASFRRYYAWSVKAGA